MSSITKENAETQHASWEEPIRVYDMRRVHLHDKQHMAINWQLMQAMFLLSYLNQGEHFILNDRGRVVFRGDDFNKHAIDKVPASDQSMKAMAAVLHTRLQDLTDAERK